jgi:hypothetical protein
MLTGKAKKDYQREYMRRRRAGLAAKPTATEPPPAPDTAKDQEIAQLKARIAELEAEVARLRSGAGKAPEWPRTPEEWAARKLAVAEERKARRAALKAAKAAAAPAPRGETIETLREERSNLQTQLKAARTRIRNLQDMHMILAKEADRRTKIIMTKELHRHIRACMHPDRAPKGQERLWTQRAQEFNGLPAKLADKSTG